MRWNINQRRTTFGDKSRRKFRASATSHIKRSAVRVQNARSALDNKPVQFLGPDGLPKGFAEAMQKIENQRFLDLDLLVRTLQDSNPPRLEIGAKNPSANRRNKESEEKSRPHRAMASLLQRRFVMKVLS